MKTQRHKSTGEESHMKTEAEIIMSYAATNQEMPGADRSQKRQGRISPKRFRRNAANTLISNSETVTDYIYVILRNHLAYGTLLLQFQETNAVQGKKIKLIILEWRINEIKQKSELYQKMFELKRYCARGPKGLSLFLKSLIFSPSSFIKI